MRSSPHSCEFTCESLGSWGLVTLTTSCPPDTLTDSPPQEQCGSVSGVRLHTGHGGGSLLPWKVHAECYNGPVPTPRPGAVSRVSSSGEGSSSLDLKAPQA